MAAETLVGRIIGVADGDTLTLLDSSKRSHKIRLSGIDAPEKKQAFGQQSKVALSNLAYRVPVPFVLILAFSDEASVNQSAVPVCLVEAV